MNYNSFLKKDYKNISLTNPKGKYQEWQQPSPRIKRSHIILLVCFLIILSGTLIFNSGPAEATRNITIEPQNETENGQVTIALPLNFNNDTSYIDEPDVEMPNFNKPDIETIIKTIDAKNKTSFGDQSTLTSTLLQEKKSIFAKLKWSSHKVKTGQSFALIFKKAKLNPRELHSIISLGESTKALKSIKPGQEIKFRISENGSLQELVYVQNSLSSLHVMKFNDGYQAVAIAKSIEKRITHAQVTIQNSLFEAGLSAGLSNSIIMDLAGIFGWDIDFALDIRSGDHFSVVYEEHFLEGEKIRDGAILAVEFVNQNRSYKAIRYTDKKNRTDYYTPEGLSMRKAFLRTPVDFRRISSRFGKRKHPILNYMRLHKGVDYVARRGTPVRASGNGKVIHKKRKGGYGRAIIIKHGGKYSTLYAHLNGYKKGLKVGQKVKQGQTIAYVGSSGRSTGPHLHYEFRVNGVHRNPLTVKLPNARPINKKFKTEYLLYATKMIAQLDSYKQIKVALNP
ncbi:Peptidase, M23/M37 family [hydrothermal vent metagenome]|uniref:Peptidase, M23/M37 family n=2 Tax=hydrothermal vent metagenome TaxID=652676 RepID=A0A3B1AAT1_9ZZZZ